MRQVLHIFDQTPNRRVSEGYEYQNPTRQRGNQNPTRQRGNQNPTRQRGNQNPKRQRGPGGTRDAAAASFLAYALRVTMGLVSSLTLRVTMGLVSSLTLRVTMGPSRRGMEPRKTAWTGDELQWQHPSLHAMQTDDAPGY